MIVSAGLGSWVTSPSEPNAPLAAIFVAAEMSPPAHLARIVASISSRRLGSARSATIALPAPKMSRGGETSAPPPKFPRGGDGACATAVVVSAQTASTPASSIA